LIQLGLYLACTSRSVSRKDLISTAMARFSFCFSRKNGVISSFSLLYEYLTTTTFYYYYYRTDGSTKPPQPVFMLSIKSSLNDFIPDKREISVKTTLV
jgi:hypothetical protein